MDRPYEVENLRRSIAMLQPGDPALDRDRALRLLADIGSLRRHLDELAAQLRELALAIEELD